MKHINSKSDDYLFNGKTFSLDNYVKMHGKEVGGDLNSGLEISASRTTGTEDFDKCIPQIAICMSMKARNSTHQSMALQEDVLCDEIDHGNDLRQIHFYVMLHTKS